ncbi:MAG TPA: hypothetical protein EYP56_01970 [Planctomycetaceae bacterium]|nr:hypothetical protein [Planctomycetaceae bacterium]HIQ22551.1 hypothetical protein [Planctomycetota bacterium]
MTVGQLIKRLEKLDPKARILCGVRGKKPDTDWLEWCDPDNTLSIKREKQNDRREVVRIDVVLPSMQRVWKLISECSNTLYMKFDEYRNEVLMMKGEG